MIEAAAWRRSVGDWRGACAAADVDLFFDPDTVRRRHGRAVAESLLADLRALAPDLLRWHMPRRGHGAGQLLEGLLIPLAEYDGADTTPTLAAATPRFTLAAGQRIVLAVVERGIGRVRIDTHADPAMRALLKAVRPRSADRYDLRRNRMFWDAACASRLRELCVTDLGDAPDFTQLQDEGRAVDACRAAGFEVTVDVPRAAGSVTSEERQRLTRWLATVPVNLPRLAGHVRDALPGADQAVIQCAGGAIILSGFEYEHGRPRAAIVPPRATRDLRASMQTVPDAAWSRPVDADLLRLGLLEPHELHPLVASALGQPARARPRHRGHAPAARPRRHGHRARGLPPARRQHRRAGARRAAGEHPAAADDPGRRPAGARLPQHPHPHPRPPVPLSHPPFPKGGIGPTQDPQVMMALTASTPMPTTARLAGTGAAPDGRGQLRAADRLIALTRAAQTAPGSDPMVQALALAAAANLPVLLWGQPGIGKSSTLAELARGLGLPLETVIASVHEPSDFSGLPVLGPDPAAEGVAMAPPDRAVRLNRSGDGLLFLDELSSAPPAVQAALLRVVLERHVGSLALPDGVRIVAAANPPGSAADGWQLAAPLANRFVHLQWVHDPAVVVRGLGGTWPRIALPRLDPDRLEHAVARARAAICGFLTVRPDYTHRMPTSAASRSGAWPSPRTWEMALRLPAFGYATDADPEAVALAVRGAVGDGAGMELLAFLERHDLPDPEAVLDDPHAVELPKRGDLVHAVLAAVVDAIGRNTTEARWRAGWVLIERLITSVPVDLLVAPAMGLAELRDPAWPPPIQLDRLGALEELPAWSE
jgi:MoxR-like ATPase